MRLMALRALSIRTYREVRSDGHDTGVALCVDERL